MIFFRWSLAKWPYFRLHNIELHQGCWNTSEWARSSKCLKTKRNKTMDVCQCQTCATQQWILNKKQRECTEARILGINKIYISAFRPLALPSNNHIISVLFLDLVVSNISYVHPYLGKIPILTNIFQRGWNHQLDMYCMITCFSGKWPIAALESMIFRTSLGGIC